jgi:hypothetical protein
MRRTIIISVFCLLFTFAINAYSADQGWYMSGNVGMTMANDIGLGSFTDADLESLTVEDMPAGSAELRYNTGFTAGAAVGFDFGNYRIESELSYQMNNFDYWIIFQVM